MTLYGVSIDGINIVVVSESNYWLLWNYHYYSEIGQVDDYYLICNSEQSPDSFITPSKLK